MKKLLSFLLAITLLITPCISSSAYSNPSSFDARDLGWVTSVKSQGTSGSCWAFSAISAIESDYIAKGYGNKLNTDFSEAYLIWFGQNTLLNKDSYLAYGDGWESSSPYTAGGNWLNAMSALESGSGIAYEKDYPYNSNQSLMGNYPETDRFNNGCDIIIENTVIFQSDETENIKEWIKEHGSATLNYHCDDTLLNRSSNGYAYFSGNQTVTSNHSVAVIGWDDNYSSSNFGKYKPSTNGAWLCKNSWGTQWGENGYFWISYEEKSIYTFEGYSVLKTDKCSNKYSYNGVTCHTGFSTSADILIANVFTAQKDESISHVTLSTFDNNSNVTVSVYTNLPANFKNPTEGTLASIVNATYKNPGYFTIKLPQVIPVKNNSKFAITISFSSDEEVCCYPMENDEHFSSRKGESFIRYNDTWYMAEELNLNNAYLGVITEAAHNYSKSQKIEPSCLINGYTVYSCQNCSSSYITSRSATGHSFGEWEITKEATTSHTGLKQRFCNNCDTSEDEIIPKKDTIFTQIIKSIKNFFSSLFRF